MSGTHSPLSDSSQHTQSTRTVAIIKSHALEHRLDIERRIEAASFEVSVAQCFLRRVGQLRTCLDCQGATNGVCLRLRSGIPTRALRKRRIFAFRVRVLTYHL